MSRRTNAGAERSVADDSQLVNKRHTALPQVTLESKNPKIRKYVRDLSGNYRTSLKNIREKRGHVSPGDFMEAMKDFAKSVAPKDDR